jgi:hypothetical protein
VTSREAMRMRADAYWAAKRWRESSEQIELLFGDRWKDFEPLTAPERADLLRAAVGYAIADDTLGLGRFREKFAAKMAEGPDARVFEVATSPLKATGVEFRDLVRQIASVDTLEGFLRDLNARFPETGSFGAPATADPAPSVPPVAPGAAASTPAPQRAAQSRPPGTDTAKTGSLGRTRPPVQRTVAR